MQQCVAPPPTAANEPAATSTALMLSLPRAGGIEDAACVWAADLLDQYVTSSALERAGWLRAQRIAGDSDTRILGPDRAPPPSPRLG